MEIEALSKAIEEDGRPIVPSLPPGTRDMLNVEFIGAHAQMWRISGDFLDRWADLKRGSPGSPCGTPM